MMCSLLNFGQIVVKASSPQEEDNSPGILEIDDFDSRAEYDKYMNRRHTFKDYQYKIEKVNGEKNGYRINLKRYTGSEKNISVPSEILNAPVRIISVGTFKNCLSLKKITIPESIYTIKKGAFSGCKAKIKKPSFLKKQKNGSYAAIAQVENS